MFLKSVETASDIAKLKKSFLIGIQSYFLDIKKKLYTQYTHEKNTRRRKNFCVQLPAQNIITLL